MTDLWWMGLVVVGVIVVALNTARNRRRQADGERMDRERNQMSGRDFVADRETSRLDHMNADDRAWEQESQRKAAQLQ